MKKNIMDTQELSEIKKLIGTDADAAHPVDPHAVEEILQQEHQATPSIPPEHTAAEKSPDVPAAAEKATIPPDTAADAPTKEAKKTPRFRIIETPLASSPGSRPSAPADPPAPQPVPPVSPEPTPTETEKPTKKRRPRIHLKQRRAAVLAEEEAALRTCDPRVTARATARRIRSLNGRAVLVGLLALPALYLSIAGGLGLPLPDLLDFSRQPVITTLALMVLLFLAMLIAVDMIGMGFYALFTGAPDRKSLVSCACTAILAHALTIILVPKWDQVLPYCAIGIFAVLASMLEERGRLTARHFTVKASLLNPSPTAVYCHPDPRDDVRRVVKAQMQGCAPFLTELEKPDIPQNISFVYTPIALAAALLFALLSSVGRGAPSRFFWAASVLLCIAMPFGILLGVGKTHGRTARFLLRDGAALTSIRGAQTLRRGRQVVFDDSDLFPIGSVLIEGLRNYGRYDNEKLLAYAAAVTSGAGLGIGRIFADKLREQYGRPVRADGILRYESGGLSADISSDNVLVGTASFLMRLGIRLRDIRGMENGVFVVINNQMAGAFKLRYQPTAQSYSALHSLRRHRPVVLTRDFNVTASMVESLFEMRSGVVEEIGGERISTICDPDYTKHDTVCAILSRDSIMPYAEALCCADKLAHVVRTRMSIGIVAGILGLLVSFFLTYTYSLAALCPQNLLLYLLFWYLPVFFVGLGIRR